MILLPSRLKVVTEDNQSGTYEIEGLYPGYGHTLGNSLRRIILSSLPGSAITNIKIEGALHEFSTVEGVREDALSIILNLKKVRFDIDGDEPQKVSLSIKGSKLVVAGDIQVPGQVQILNPDQYICEITSKTASISIDMTVSKGRGYVSREVHSKEKVDVGTIAVDAVFSPIRKVSYEVENMRVGDRTDHNRLRISIQTDGTLTAREALEESMKIMMKQIQAILNLKDEEIDMIAPSHEANPAQPVISSQPDETSSMSSQSEEDLMDVLKTRVDNMEFSTRTLNALDAAGIRTIGGLVRKTTEDLLELEGLGEKAVQEIKDVLQKYSVNLKD